ncbi:TPA: DNA cytosine methyltransferase [Escherichia coli]|nr:DNA cytosine methyltransferase [Escherichia coli]HCO3884080.1 DNA cytosine methyltransferase [Escherichia coli]
MSTAYYNEIDPYAAQWLRNLIDAGQIAHGIVDERSIEDVTPNDLRGFTQCHFFAGIGVWSYALRQAGWSDDRPVWTGSCPCQPFSAAGKGAGFDDERHLWPAFQWLIKECKPQHVFGEQVASSNANEWFDLVQSDLEGMDYAFGIMPFTSASIGAPHIRERAYWVAYSAGEQYSKLLPGLDESNGEEGGREAAKFAGLCCVDGLGNTNVTRLERHIRNDCAAGREAATRPVTEAGISDRPLEVNGFWRDADWLFCRDEQWRPVESGTFPLVARFAKSLGHGKSSLRALAGRNRTVRLKGYGNAINAEAARHFIQASVECMPC